MRHALPYIYTDILYIQELYAAMQYIFEFYKNIGIQISSQCIFNFLFLEVYENIIYFYYYLKYKISIIIILANIYIFYIN